ncbi:down syndrome cell adhesion molecule [Trichonephila clavipes]|nr:down syndrome cell adhesion molecule [Trichonephila clavipes]
MPTVQDGTIEISDYDTTKSHHLQSITEEGIPCDIDDFIIHEKLAMGNMWTPNHRWRANEIISHDGSYSPLHVHAQTFVTDGQELSDAECDRDLRHMSESGTKSRPYEKHPKYLGYILDPEILSNKHIDNVINKGRKRLDLLKYITGRDWGADVGTLRLTYTSLIRPVLEYGSQIYFSASRTNLAKLDRVQSSAVRVITDMRHSCPTDLVLFEADILPLDLRRKLLLSKYFCKLYSYGDYNRTSAYLIT